MSGSCIAGKLHRLSYFFITMKYTAKREMERGVERLSLRPVSLL